MSKTLLLTDWVKIGTAGPTKDGREIQDSTLLEMADTYDPDEYTAVIKSSHDYGYNFGSVRELRTAKDKKGRTVLQARLQPNYYYLSQNSMSSKLFTSMEVQHNFAKSGKAYLTGLAATDNPASLGTTELHFDAEKTPDLYISAPIEVDFALPDDEKTGLFSMITTAVSAAFSTQKKETETKTNPEEIDMTPEELQAAIDKAMQPFSARIDAIDEKFKALDTDKNTDKNPDANPDGDAGGSGGDTAGQNDFSAALKDAVKPLADGIADLKSKFEALSKTGESQQTGENGNGAADDGKTDFI
jgi:hypothetical protein